MRNKSPRPKEPGRLFRRLFASGEAAPFFSALDQSRAEIESAEGAPAARRWLRAQIRRSAPGLIKSALDWRLAMLASDLKAARRNLSKHKAYSAITTAGLAVGAAACLLISLYVKQELSYDNYHPNGDRVYRLLVKSSFTKGRPSPAMSLLAAPTLRNGYPEVEIAARLIRAFRTPLFKRGAEVFPEDGFLYVEPELFDILAISFLRGRPDEGLFRPGTMILSESLAVKYFGRQDPVGQTLVVDGAPVEIVGIVQDAPANTHLKYQGFFPFRVYESRIKTLSWTPGWTHYDPHTYLRVRPGTDIEAFGAKIARLSAPYLDGQGGSEKTQEYSLQPVRAVHLDTETVLDIEPPANPQTLLMLSGLALIILGLAVLNFINLATAQAAGRAKEVGVRKAIGAERPRLVRQFLGESFLVTLLALGAGFLLALAALGPFNRFAGTSFAFTDLVRPGFLAIEVGLLLSTSLGAGLYPALFLSAFRPASVLRKDASIRLKGGRLRRVFVVGQFAVATTLIAVTLGMNRQLRYMNSAPLGFDKEQKLVVVFPEGRGSLPSAISGDRQRSLKDELLRRPGVLSATLSSSVPGRGFFYQGTRRSGQNAKEYRDVRYVFTDENFLADYKIDLAAGRPVLRGSADREVLLNETAVRLFDWTGAEEALGQKLNTGSTEERTIVGVVRDFHQEGLQTGIKPLGMLLAPDRCRMLTLTFVPGRVREVLDLVRRAWSSLVPDYPLDYFFLDDDFARQYAKESRTASMFSVFAGMGIFIGCLGLVGLAAFLAEKKTKEIGIRKVLGASVPGILGRLSGEFAAGVLVANAFAWPVAWLVLGRWLSRFAFRSAPNVGTFVAAGGLALALAMLSVGWKSFRAARANPVESLRYE